MQRASYHPRDHLGTISGPLDRNEYLLPDSNNKKIERKSHMRFPLYL